MTAWSLVHSAWIRNRFVVQESQTAFEKAFDRVYNGLICSFGEVVLALFFCGHLHIASVGHIVVLLLAVKCT